MVGDLGLNPTLPQLGGKLVDPRRKHVHEAADEKYLLAGRAGMARHAKGGG